MANSLASFSLITTFGKIAWVFALICSIALWGWHLSLAPFANPGSRMNEAGVVYLALMLARWVALALVCVLLATYAIKVKIPITKSLTFACITLALHFGLGLLNLRIWNKWTSNVPTTEITTQLWAMVTYYYLCPLPLLLGSIWVWKRLAAASE